MEKRKSEFGIQYLLQQNLTENFWKHIESNPAFLQPFVSLWNGIWKLSYPIEDKRNVWTYLRHLDRKERTEKIAKIAEEIEVLKEDARFIDAEEIYVDKKEHFYYIFLPDYNNGVKDWTKELEHCCQEEEGTVISESAPEIPEEIILEEIDGGQRFFLRHESYVLGKSAERADIVISGSPSVSRRHCRIFYREGKYYVEDLGSLNHTYKNGILLESEETLELERGDRIRMSDIEFLVR